ncbi:MAG: gluconate 2-dehydrogenase subunit 3 family protein [Acidobacteriaceae bacterium]|nr:gluconate 2-dehydrogenase subunit 3 family protein [Acidobacteriaceae bacterium]
MFDTSRRELLQNAAAALLAGVLPLEAAQHVHRAAADDKVAGGGVYEPKAFNDHEYQTLVRLADLIVPADEHSPGAVAAGALAFIDLLSSQNPDLAAIYTGGVAWLDRHCAIAYSTTFLAAKPDQQTAVLDKIAYQKNASPDLGAGIKFFTWARRMVVDAYYTTPIGVKELGFMGNTAVAKFEVPQNVMDYVNKRSPV